MNLKSLFILAILSFCICFLNAQNFDWANSMIGAPARGTAMVTDDDGNIYVTGNVNGITDFDPGPNEALSTTMGVNGDIFIVKYNSNGEYIWHMTLGSWGVEIPKDLELDNAGNLIVVGRFNSYMDWDPGLDSIYFSSGSSTSGFVAKYDTDGNYIWAQPISTGGFEEAYSVEVDEADNIYVCGYASQDVDFDIGEDTVAFEVPDENAQDAYLIKYNANGNFKWVKGLQGPGRHIAFSVAYGQAGDLYLHGTFHGDETIQESGETAGLVTNGFSDVFIAKYDTSGVYHWGKSFGGSSNDIGDIIRADGNGHIYIMGAFKGIVDLDPGPAEDFEGIPNKFLTYFSKLDTAGNVIWSHSIHGEYHFDGVADLIVDESGDVFLTSTLFIEYDLDVGLNTVLATPVNPYDLYIVKYNGEGEYLWSQVIYTGGSFDASNALAIDQDGNLFVTGGYGHEAIFDSTAIGGIQTGPVGMVGYIAKYGTSGCIRTTSLLELNQCEAYTSPSGEVFSTSGMYWDTIPNFAGCDSIIILDLLINDASNSIDVQTACDSFEWIDGNTYTTSNNTATFTLTNSIGCDSIITLDLLINDASNSVDVQSACESFEWIDGNIYTANNNTATFTLTNSLGCDSIITLNLTLTTPTTTTIDSLACDSIYLLDAWYYENTVIYDSLLNVNACDSILVYNIFVTSINTMVIEEEGTLISEAINANYAWLDCENNFTEILNANDLSYTPNMDGTYAVEVTLGNCVDTSNCILVNTVNTKEIADEQILEIFPNPTKDKFSLEIQNWQEDYFIEIINLEGKKIYNTAMNSSNMIIHSTDWPSGIYYLYLKDEEGLIKGTKKLIISK